MTTSVKIPGFKSRSCVLAFVAACALVLMTLASGAQAQTLRVQSTEGGADYLLLYPGAYVRTGDKAMAAPTERDWSFQPASMGALTPLMVKPAYIFLTERQYLDLEAEGTPIDERLWHMKGLRRSAMLPAALLMAPV